MSVGPHDPRRGRLRHGNAGGDLDAVRRCGARTRQGSACRQPAMANGRCRLHGGKSTGPRTAEGLERCQRTRWKHGLRSNELNALKRAGRQTLRSVSDLIPILRLRFLKDLT